MMLNIKGIKQQKKLWLNLAVTGAFAVTAMVNLAAPSNSEAAASQRYITSLAMDVQGFKAVPATNISDEKAADSKGKHYTMSLSMDSQGFTPVAAANIPNVEMTVNEGQKYITSLAMDVQDFEPVAAANIHE